MQKKFVLNHMQPFILAVYLSMFGSMYTFEAAFSTMNIIKSNFRNRLTSHRVLSQDCFDIISS